MLIRPFRRSNSAVSVSEGSTEPSAFRPAEEGSSREGWLMRSLSPWSSEVTVLPGADMAVGVQWQAAERAWRAAGRDDLERPVGERPGLGRGDPDAEHRDGGVLVSDVDVVVLADLLRLDDDPF